MSTQAPTASAKANRLNALGSGMLLAGCSPSGTAIIGNDGQITYENNAEKVPLLAGKPFHEAIANRDYERAFSLLSEHAKRNVSRRQVAQNLSL